MASSSRFPTLDPAELYASRLVAAPDRQQQRDLFDIIALVRDRRHHRRHGRMLYEHAEQLPALRWKLANLVTFQKRRPDDFSAQA
ncbi:nucleotidyl transferase AbiEii/AbiGii toxin family protein [Pseudomonas helleri]|uniref:nucleotidyl transferase AbiEii/AbiGii toxin family protein n=1 Tax=Pseudomonas helleri TaxID=1608996 RepID=UPI00242ED494|nr:nucleotidyl transferase AbiEii/AbiGii toxin family protein [Pseudomonas helleri]